METPWGAREQWRAGSTIWWWLCSKNIHRPPEPASEFVLCTCNLFHRFFHGYKYCWSLSVCLGYFSVTQRKEKQSKHPGRGNSQTSGRPPSHPSKTWRGTPQRKPSLMQRKINVEKCPKGKKTGLECYGWFCLEVPYKILDLERTL